MKKIKKNIRPFAPHKIPSFSRSEARGEGARRADEGVADLHSRKRSVFFLRSHTGRAQHPHLTLLLPSQKNRLSSPLASLRARIILFFILCFAISSIFAFDESTYHFTSTKDATRFETLINETRCLVCQNQAIADSNAPLANDLREKIYKMVLEKKSNAEIEAYLVNRYGEFILFRPRFNKSTVLLWAFPFAALLGVFTFLIFKFSRTCKY